MFHRPEHGCTFSRGDKDRSISIHNHNTRSAPVKKSTFSNSLLSRSASPLPMTSSAEALKTSHSAPVLSPSVNSRKKFHPMRSLPPSPPDSAGPEKKGFSKANEDLPLKKRLGTSTHSHTHTSSHTQSLALTIALILVLIRYRTIQPTPQTANDCRARHRSKPGK